MSIKTEFILPASSVQVTHDPTTGDPGRTGNGVVVTEADVEPDTLTTIEVQRQETIDTVQLLWQPQSWHPMFSVLFMEETSVLFVGAGTFSAVIDINAQRIVHQHTVDLFWSFKQTRNSILELGEIECFLYKRNGELVGSVPVDPPYEVIESDDEVQFVTSLFGTQRIPFP